jgi:cytochrome P450
LLDRIGRLVDEALDFEEGEGGNDWSEPKSIIKQLLKNKSLDRKDIKASVVDYIIAGVDTIGNSIIFTIALIAKHPEVQRRLQQEVDQFLSSGDDLTVASFQEMKYLRACVMESFRIYPTADQVRYFNYRRLYCVVLVETIRLD